MLRFLALPADERRSAFDRTAAVRSLPAASIEKDFWVSFALKQLFSLPGIGEHLTFKGGTSLSKAWGLIDRFSEDIDLTIDRDFLGFSGDAAPEQSQSRREQQRRIEGVKRACQLAVADQVYPGLNAQLARIMPSGEPWSLTLDREDEDRQTVPYHYPQSDPGPRSRYLRPVVKLEFGARSDPWPADLRPVRSIVASELPALFDELDFDVRALRPERTFWEKAMLLHEERARHPDKRPREALARHYSDLYRLIENGTGARAAADDDLLRQVAEHRRAFFRHGNVNYDLMCRGSIELLPADAQLNNWRQDYEAMQGEMFATRPPDFDTVLAVIARFQSEFNAA